MFRSTSPVVLGFSVLVFFPATASAQSPIEGVLQDISATPPQQAVGSVVEIACPRGNNEADFQARCNEIVLSTVIGGRDIPGSQAGLQAMAAEEDHVLSVTQTDLPAGGQGLTSQRVSLASAGAAGRSTLTVNGRQMPLGEVLGAAAGDGFQNWNAYIDFGYAMSDRDATSRQSGFDADTWSVLGGVEYDYSTNTFAGLALGFTHTDADLDANGGNIESDEFHVQLYGSHYLTDRLHLDGTLGYTRADMDQSRAVRYSILNVAGTATTTVNQLALSGTDSDTLSASALLGYDIQHGDWALMPYARFEVAKTDIDGFTERMSNPNAPGSGLATRIDDQSVTSMPLSFGFLASRPVDTGWGRLTPQLAAEAVIEFDNDPDDITGSFVGDPGATQFTLVGDDADSFYGRYSVGAALELGERTTGLVAYQGLMGYRDLSIHAFQLSFQHRW